ncbi:isochorismatase family protein [Peribacillus asahii]|uniref:isochorismatase family protein n=1 Tax=Peribacillus asahii TaxID=228899 RepID=UPI0038097DC5
MKDEKVALLVMDLQFGPLWGTYKKEETMLVIKKLIKKAELEDILIIYTQHEELPGGFLVKGSQYWQFEQGISPRSKDIIIHKQATDAFHNTSLKDELRKREITRLVVVGARTEYCVDTTCRAAIALGFNVTLVEDGHTCIDGVIPAESIIKHHNYNLNTVATLETCISVLPSDQVIFRKES